MFKVSGLTTLNLKPQTSNLKPETSNRELYTKTPTIMAGVSANLRSLVSVIFYGRLTQVAQRAILANKEDNKARIPGSYE